MVQSALAKNCDPALVAFPRSSQFRSSPPYSAPTVSSARTLVFSLLGWHPTALSAWSLFLMMVSSWDVVWLCA